MLDISFSKPPSRNSMFTHLVYNEDKVISFLYIPILIYICDALRDFVPFVQF